MNLVTLKLRRKILSYELAYIYEILQVIKISLCIKQLSTKYLVDLLKRCQVQNSLVNIFMYNLYLWCEHFVAK